MPSALSLRFQLLLALLGPLAALAAILGERAVSSTGDAVEAELARRLTTVAGAVAAVSSDRVLALGPGDDDTRTARNTHTRLASLQARTEVARILLMRVEDDRVLIDTSGQLPIGATYRRAQFDRLELERVRTGETAHSILFVGPDSMLYKTGYAPLTSKGEVRAYVAVAAPVTYLDRLQDLRLRILLIAAVGLTLTGAVAIAMADRLARPLTDLAEAARKVGAGELSTPIEVRGPREARILAETMRQMAHDLAERDRHLQMMLAGIAHEVRNPLGGIELFGHLLAEDLEGDPRRSHVDKILGELQVLARVVNDFLDYARRQPHRAQTTDLGELLFEVCSLVQPLADERSIAVDMVVPSPPPLVGEVDRASLQRALVNLLRNAAQAAKTRARLEVTRPAGPKSEPLRFAVEDDGPGVPEKIRGELFTPFFTTKQKGTGLGLALVDQTVKAHGGKVEVGTSELGGARFVIEIPPTPDGKSSPKSEDIG